jgi:hypothetical protein
MARKLTATFLIFQALVLLNKANPVISPDAVEPIKDVVEWVYGAALFVEETKPPQRPMKRRTRNS